MNRETGQINRGTDIIIFISRPKSAIENKKYWVLGLARFISRVNKFSIHIWIKATLFNI